MLQIQALNVIDIFYRTEFQTIKERMQFILKLEQPNNYPQIL